MLSFFKLPSESSHTCKAGKFVDTTYSSISTGRGERVVVKQSWLLLFVSPEQRCHIKYVSLFLLLSPVFYSFSPNAWFSHITSLGQHKKIKSNLIPQAHIELSKNHMAQSLNKHRKKWWISSRTKTGGAKVGSRITMSQCLKSYLHQENI